MNNKTCTKCKTSKDIKQFYIYNSGQSVKAACKDCLKALDRIRHKNTYKTKVRLKTCSYRECQLIRVNGSLCLEHYRAKKKEHAKLSRIRNPYQKKELRNCLTSGCPNKIGHTSINALCRSCYIVKTRYRDNLRAKNYFKNNRQKIYRRLRDRYSNDTAYRLSVVLRSRLRSAIKNNIKSGSAIKDLGCSIDELKKHLESKFQSGMTWNNWGRGDAKWHIDHVVPLTYFDLTDYEQLKKACHYTNLQPLWETENLTKGAKFGS